MNHPERLIPFYDNESDGLATPNSFHSCVTSSAKRTTFNASLPQRYRTGSRLTNWHAHGFPPLVGKVPLPPCHNPWGDYELLEEVGRGGMGVVYRARQKSLDRVVCTKMILTGRLAGPRDVERFLAEAKAMASLRHPNIVTVYEVGSYEDQYFYSMEFVPGETLSDMVKNGPVSADQAASFMLSVAHAIAYAHEEGVIHRDLKPSNVIVDDAMTPRVMDFGLSRGIEAGGLTSTGALAGTPSYMAPELTKGDRSAGTECDIYGLGAVLYELLVARPPFQGETPLDTLLQVRENEPARPSLLNPRIPRDLETICLKCLSKNPVQRYASASEVAGELGRFLRHEPILARPISPLARFTSWCRRNPLPVTLAATVFIALLTISGVLLYSNHRQAEAYSALQTEKDNLATSMQATDEANSQLRQERNRLTQTQEQLASYLSLSRIRRATQAVTHGDLFEVEEVLKELEPQSGMPDTRGWEWYYLRTISRQYRASQDLNVAIRSSFPLDGHRVVALDDAGNLHLMDRQADSHRIVARLNDTYGCVAWNEPSGQIAVGMDNGSVALIDVGNFDKEFSQAIAKESVSSFSTGSRHAVRSVAWNRSGTMLACGLDDGTLAIIDPRSTVITSTVMASVAVHADGINSISWSHDDQWIATASDDFAAKVTSTSEFQSGSKASTMLVARFNEWVNAVAFAPDAMALAMVTRDGQFQVWDFTPTEGKLSPTLRFSRSNARGEEISAVAWSNQGKHLVTGGESSEILIWSTETGRCERHLYGHRQAVRSLSWRETSVVSAGDDGTIKWWDSDRSPEGQVISDTNVPVRFVTWHSTLPLAAWRDVDGLITVWDNERRRIPTRFAESITSATGLAWHPTRPLLALSREESVLIYDLDDDSAIIQLDHDEGDYVWHLRWSPDGKTLATSGAMGTPIIWNPYDTKRSCTVNELRDVSTLCWSHRGELLYVIGAKGTINGVDPSDGSHRTIGSIDKHSAKSISASRDGKYLAVSTESGQILIVSLSSEEQFALRGHQGTAWSCIWASDDRRLISGGQDGTIRLWDVASRQETLRLSTHSAAVWSLDINANRQLLSASADGSVRLWGEP